MEFSTVLQLIQIGTLTGFLLIVVVYGGYKEWWYFGPPVRKQMNERDERIGALIKSSDEWKQLAMSQLTAAKQAAENQSQIAGAIRAMTGTRGHSDGEQG